MATKREDSQDVRVRTTYLKPQAKVQPAAVQPDVLSTPSHVTCDVDADACPGQVDENG